MRLTARLVSILVVLSLAPLFAETAAQPAEPSRATLETQLAAAKSDLATAEAKLATTATQTARLTALEAESARATKQVATLQTKLDEATADRVLLKQKLADGARAPAPKPDESAPQIAALQAQVASLTAAKSAAEQKLAASEARVSASPAVPAASADREELSAANAKLESVLHSFMLAQSENAGLKVAVEVAKNESNSLRQQLADAQSKTTAPSAASAEDPVALKRELNDTATKLSVALRSYVVIASENDRLKADAAARTNSSAQAVAAVETKAAAAATTQSTQLAELRDQLRQVQAQSAAYAEDNFQLRTRLASAGGGAAPSRAPDRVMPTAVPTSAPVPSAAAPVVEPVQRTHTIAAGDTLQGLAKKYYGDAARWNEILTANSDVLGGKPNLVIGRKLRIP